MVALGLYGLISLRRKHAVPESSFRETPYNILDRVVRNAFKRNCLAWFYHVIRGVFGGVAQVCSIVNLYACLLNTSVLSEAVLQDHARPLYSAQWAKLVSYNKHWTDPESRGKSFGCLYTSIGDDIIDI